MMTPLHNMAHQNLVAVRESPREGKTRVKDASNAKTESERDEKGRRIASLAPLEPVDQYADARGRMHLLILIGTSRGGRDSARGCR